MLDQGQAPPVATEARRPAHPLLRRKPVEQLVAEGGQGEGGSLRRSLTMWQLTMISIGATLGTGIFVVLGTAAPKAGPAVTISFVIAGLTALFSALSYAELAGSVPVSGSSYSYSYATMGELVAWVCGWCLVLEYGVSVAAVAVGWGEYLNELLDGTIGITIPEAVSAPLGEGGFINLPALVVVLLAMVFLMRGAKESARINSIMVGVKIVTLLLFIGIGFMGIKAGNYAPLAPSASPASAPARPPSSSRTSASTPPPPPVKRPRTPSGTCRARSCSRWRSSPSCTSSSPSSPSAPCRGRTSRAPRPRSRRS